jgi:hypothetical protein
MIFAIVVGVMKKTPKRDAPSPDARCGTGIATD